MEELKSLDQILAEIKAGDASQQGIQKIAPNSGKNDMGVVKDIAYDVPTNAVYDRLSDGTYIPRFENYAGAVGNEDRLAKEQTWYEQAGYGLVKNIRKAGNYAIDAVAGTVYGAMSAVYNQDFEKLYDNDFSNTLEDWNKQLDYKLPNYYSDEQKSQGFFRSALTTNFWFNDVAGGLAFVGGVLLPEAIKGFITGGTSVPLALSKYGAKAIFKSTDDFLKAGFKEGLEQTTKSTILGTGANIFDKVNDFHTAEKGTNLLRAFQRANYIKTGGDALKTGLFLARSSNFEAGMEARHNFKDAMSEYYETFEEKNGRLPTFDETLAFSDQARIASNGVYAANMGILMLSNAAMFGKTFGIGTKSLARLENRALGIGVSKQASGELILSTPKKFQKIGGSLFNILSKPAIEGIYEEGFQGVAGKTMQNYLRAKYDPEKQDGFSTWAALSDAFAEQYGTKEGWKEMGIGLIIGFAGGALQGNGFEGIGKNSRRAAEARVGEQVEEVNRGVQTLRNVNRASTIKNFRNVIESGADSYQSTSAENAMMNVEFIKSQEHLKSRSEIQEDFNTIVDNMELDSQTLDEVGVENIETYKDSLKEEFSRNVKDYNFARKTVSSLGLERYVDTAGNVHEVGEALTMQIVLGKDALSSAKNIADQIGTTVGSSGVFNYMQFYNNLDDSQKKNISQLRYKRRRLKELEKLAVQYGQRSAGVQIQGKRNLKDSTVNNRYLQNTEKLVLAQQEMTQLQEQIQDISETLGNDFRASNFDLDGSIITQGSESQDILTALDELDKLDSYKEALRRNGKNYDADSLDYLTTQFKIFSDTHRELNNTVRKMLSADYFSSTEGRGMISSILGEKYRMSEEFVQIINDNNELIDNSLGATGQLRGTTTVAEYIAEAIEKNPQLSEREKRNLETILRLQLGIQAIQEQLEIITDVEVEFDSEKQGSTSPLEGDTVLLREKLNIEESDLNNLSIINTTIQKIMSQIDYLRSSSRVSSNEKIQDTNTASERLSNYSVENENQPGDYENLVRLAERIRNGEETGNAEDIQLGINYPGLLELLIPDDIVSKQLVLEMQEGSQDLKARTLNSLSETTGALTNSEQIRIIDSAEYIRLNELMIKRESQGLSQEETDELGELEDDINQWLYITGTVANGLRLSDLIRQKVILETTPIEPVENVASATPQDILDGVDFGDRTGNANYSLAQSYDAVTAIGDPKTGNIAISGITPDSLIEEVGFEFPYLMNERGNILISPEVQNTINSDSNISILPTNADLSTSYSIVIKHAIDINGNSKSFPLKSNYSDDFSEAQNTDAIYSHKAGDTLFLEIDPQDEYNTLLLNEYRNAAGTEGRTEEELNDLAVILAAEYIQSDLSLNSMKTELTDIKKQVQSAPTIAVKNELNKRIKTLDTKIGAREDKLTDKAEVDAYKPSPRNEEKMEESLEGLKRGAVIRVRDEQGNFLAVLKGKNSSAVKNQEDLKFEAFRDQIMTSPELLDQLANLNLAEELNIPGLTVKKIFLGHPNFNFVRNEDGSVGIEYRRLTDRDADKITDIGFIQNGSLQTRSRVAGIDTTFLNKFIRTADPSQKIPFVVFEKEGTRVAYPVRVEQLLAMDNSEFVNVFNSEVSDSSKVAALNKILASRGIDIREPGNAFVMIGETNLNEDFFHQKLRQLEEMQYFSDVTSWLDPQVNMNDILTEQISINIDLSNPLHSPKLQIDFDQVDVEIPVEVVSEEKKRVIKKDTPTQSALHSILGKDIQDEAEEQINEDC